MPVTTTESTTQGYGSVLPAGIAQPNPAKYDSVARSIVATPASKVAGTAAQVPPVAAAMATGLVPAGAAKEAIEAIAVASEPVRAQGAPVKRVIVVPGRLVNVVV